MPIVAPNTYRLAVVGTAGGRTWANVFHTQRLGSSPPEVADAAAILGDAYADTILPLLTDSVTCTGVNYVDLSSLSGDSGTIPWPAAEDSGGDGGAPAPMQVAYLMRWNAAGGRAQRNGRSYFPGVNEQAVLDNGTVETDKLNALTSAANDFITALQTGDLGLSVISSVDGDTYAPRAISAGICDTRVATQRRRLRG